MARHVRPIKEEVIVNLNEEKLAADVKSIDEFSVIEAGYSADRDLLNGLIGRRSLAVAAAKLFTVTDLSTLQYIKETKLYRVSKGIKIRDTSRILDGTWADFCANVVGKSVEQVDEDLRNLKTFGEAALDTMQQAGIGYRDLRQYRKLPADEKTALIEAAKEGDKDTLLDLAETLIAKHTKEKTELLKENKELTERNEATERVLADKNTVNDKLAMQLNTREQRVAQMSPDEIAKELRSQAVTDGFEAEHAIQHKLGATFKALTEHSLDNGGEHKQFMLGLVVQIELELLKVREEFGLHGAPTTDNTPWWLTTEGDAELEKAKADWAKKLASPEWQDHPAANVNNNSSAS